VTVDTDKDVVVVHDGSTAGGIPLAKEASVLPLAGGTMTGDVSLGDNVKAKFGAGDDLQIYHDGGSSKIQDTGVGELQLLGSNLSIKSWDGAESYINCVDNSYVQLRHNNAVKLATTSTGIDVTGSVTCDGFTSTGIDDNATSTAITIDSSEDVTFSNAIIRGTGGGAGLANNYSIANKQTAANAFGFVAEASGNDAWLRMGHNGTEAVIETAWQTTAGTTPLIFKTNGVERLRINESSGGITFNGDTAAANALDDYEEGTWTPALSGSVTAGSTTYLVQVGKYEKIGRQVTIRGRIAVNLKGTLDGAVSITGLPYTSSASSGAQGILNFGYTSNLGITASESLTCLMGLSATTGGIKIWNATTGTSNLDDSEIGDAISLYFEGSYHVD
jgi:hypothetical protein